MRILNLSEKFKQRPSEIIGIKDTYEAFCLDEACELILSYKDYDNEGNLYWIKEPNWIDGKTEKKNNNADLIKEMQSQLLKQNRNP